MLFVVADNTEGCGVERGRAGWAPDKGSRFGSKGRRTPQWKGDFCFSLASFRFFFHRLVFC